MKAIDTNVVVRIITGDDPLQTPLAVALLESGAALFVSLTVAMETEWVLRSAYGWPSERIADALAGFARLRSIQVEDAERFAWAIGRLRAGADFSDMVHLAAARAAALFVTFDRRLAQGADDAPLIEVETLG